MYDIYNYVYIYIYVFTGFHANSIAHVHTCHCIFPFSTQQSLVLFGGFKTYLKFATQWYNYFSRAWDVEPEERKTWRYVHVGHSSSWSKCCMWCTRPSDNFLRPTSVFSRTIEVLFCKWCPNKTAEVMFVQQLGCSGAFLNWMNSVRNSVKIRKCILGVPNVP